jgi:hypothetical protein
MTKRNLPPKNTVRNTSHHSVLVAQLKLLLRRAELGFRVSVGSVLRTAWLVREIEGDR